MQDAIELGDQVFGLTRLGQDGRDASLVGALVNVRGPVRGHRDDGNALSPLLAANLVQDAIGADDTELILFDDVGRHVLPRAPKLEQARQLIAHVGKLLAQPRAARR